MTQPHNTGAESVESLKADQAAATEPAAAHTESSAAKSATGAPSDVRTGDELKAYVFKQVQDYKALAGEFGLVK